MAQSELPLFLFTTQEDWYGEITIQLPGQAGSVDISNRVFEMWITPGSTGNGIVAPSAVLKIGEGLSFKSTDTIVFRLAKTTTKDMARGEYTADILEVFGDERHLFIPVRARYSEPTGIVAFHSRALGVTWVANRQPIVAALGVPGAQGQPGRTIITSTSPPSSAQGTEGDYWIHDRSAAGMSRRMYGPKTGSTWPGPWSIEGGVTVEQLQAGLDTKADDAEITAINDMLAAVNRQIAALDSRTNKIDNTSDQDKIKSGTPIGDAIAAAAQSGGGGTARSIKSVAMDGNGHLIVTFSDNTTTDVGRVLGLKGDKGDSVKGDPGTSIKGDPGVAGRGITNATVNAQGRLILTYSDGSTQDVGTVGGGSGTANPFTRFYISAARGNLTAGQTQFTIAGGYVAGTAVVFFNGVALDESEFTATNGTSITISNPPVAADTKIEVWISASTPVRGITKVERNSSDHMIVTYTDGATADLGLVVGPAGTKGDKGDSVKGDAGSTGRGITSALIDGNGHLIITYTDGATADAGVVAGSGATTATGISFTPTGNIAATNVQTALAEVDNEKLAKASNLGDLTDAAAARNNLQLGSAARLTAGSAAGNVPVLDASGLLLASLMPALAITDVFPVASQSAMLALTAQRGDVAVRTDQGTAYILKTDDPTTLANWIALPLPAGVVMMVAGLSGPNITASQLIQALGLVIGTNVQAWDADLDAIAALTTAAYGRSLLTFASKAAVQTELAVPSKGAGSDIRTLTDDAKFLTAKSMADAMAFSAQTWAATIALDWTGGFHRTITATGNTTFSGPFVGGADGEAVAFELVQGSGGNFTIAFSGTYFKLPTGLTITASTAAGAVDIVTGQLRLISGTLVFQILGFVKGAR